MEVSVGLGPEGRVSVLMQLSTYLSVTLGTWRELLELGLVISEVPSCLGLVIFVLQLHE